MGSTPTLDNNPRIVVLSLGILCGCFNVISIVPNHMGYITRDGVGFKRSANIKTILAG